LQISCLIAYPINCFNVNSDTKKEFEKAIEDYSKAIKFDSTYFIAYSNRAIAYYETGNYINALNDLNKAITLNNNFGQAYINRGIVKYKLQDYDGACNDWESSIELGENEGGKYFQEYCK
jgi:tetratricopeptide (TPR) repeat protein